MWSFPIGVTANHPNALHERADVDEPLPLDHQSCIDDASNALDKTVEVIVRRHIRQHHHRLLVLREKLLAKIPRQIRYFQGAERVPNSLAAFGLPEIVPNTVVATKRCWESPDDASVLILEEKAVEILLQKALDDDGEDFRQLQSGANEAVEALSLEDPVETSGRVETLKRLADFGKNGSRDVKGFGGRWIGNDLGSDEAHEL